MKEGKAKSQEETKKELQDIVREFESVYKRRKLKVNVKKSKVMGVEKGESECWLWLDDEM